MKLILGTGGEIEAPSAGQIEEALRALPGGDDSFAILEQHEQTYMQTSGGGGEGFVLEYRDGAPGAHFQCTDHRLSVDDTVAAFLDYLEGRSDYKTRLAWAPLEAGTGRSPRVLIAVVGTLAALAFALYRCGT